MLWENGFVSTTQSSEAEEINNKKNTDCHRRNKLKYLLK
jgi:hypothetical protein